MARRRGFSSCLIYLAGFLMVTGAGRGIGRALALHFARKGARLALRCDSPFIQQRAAADGLGIAELTCFLGDAAPDLVRVWPQAPPAMRTAWLIVHQDLRRAARIRAVSGAIVDEFRRQRRILKAGDPD